MPGQPKLKAVNNPRRRLRIRVWFSRFLIIHSIDGLDFNLQSLYTFVDKTMQLENSVFELVMLAKIHPSTPLRMRWRGAQSARR